MDAQITAIYSITDDILKAMSHDQDSQQQMTDAEVITTALVAMRFFGGNFERARHLLSAPTYIPAMLSKSRFNRRLHALKEVVLMLFKAFGEVFKQLNAAAEYIIDTFPLAVCDNIRIRRCQIYQSEAYRGYKPSKRRYFYGLKIHLMVTAQGQPVEFFLTPGAVGDVDGLKVFEFDLPVGSIVYGDKAFTDYELEDLLFEACGIHLRPCRKKNSKRPVPSYVAYIQQRVRKLIETAGSLIERLLPKSIHVVTAKGFELKAALFVLAHSFSCAL